MEEEEICEECGGAMVDGKCEQCEEEDSEEE